MLFLNLKLIEKVNSDKNHGIKEVYCLAWWNFQFYVCIIEFCICQFVLAFVSFYYLHFKCEYVQVQDINFAMEASRKSQISFVTANSREETKYREGLPSVKKALDFSFQDMDGFLRLVRLAMEAISR